MEELPKTTYIKLTKIKGGEKTWNINLYAKNKETNDEVCNEIIRINEMFETKYPLQIKEGKKK